MILPDYASTRKDLSLVDTRLRRILRTAASDSKVNLLSRLRNLMLLRCSDASRWLQHSASRAALRELRLNCASFRIGCLLVLHAEAAAELTQLLGWSVLEYLRLLKVVLSEHMLHDDRLDLAVAGLSCILLGFHSMM